MSLNELIVVVVCGLLGFGIVFHFMRTREMEGGSTAPADRAPPWHAVLGVVPDASLDEIQAAYESKIAQYGQAEMERLGPDLRGLAERQVKAIESAYRMALELKASETRKS